MQIGPGDIYSFNENGDITGSTAYDKWEKVQVYNGLAPRLSASYILNEKSSIKG